MKRMKLNIQLFAVSSSVSMSQGTGDVSTNKTSVTVTFTIKRTSGTTYWANNKDLTFYVTYYNDNGTTTTSQTTIGFNFPSGSVGATKSASATFSIPHKSDGTQSVYYKAQTANTGTSAGVITAEGSWTTLTTIPRNAKITEFKVNQVSGYVGLTRVNVTWKTDSTIDYLWYSKDNGSNWIGYDTADGTSGSFNIDGLTAGQTYNFKLKVRRKDSQRTSDPTGAVSQATHAKNKISSTVPASFTNESELTVTASNPSKATCNIKLELPNNGYVGIARRGVTTTKFTKEDFASLFQYLPTTPKVGQSVTVRVTVDTTDGTNYYYDTADRPLSLVNTDPTFGGFTYEDINQKTLDLTRDPQKLIVGYSTLKTIITPENKAVAKNYATIDGYRTTIGDSFDAADYSATETVTMEIPSVKGGLINVTATDSRGYVVTKSQTPNLIDYMPLTKEGTEVGYRTEEDLTPNGVSDLVAISFAGKLWKEKPFGQIDGVDNNNEIISAQYRFKKGNGDFEDYKDIENLAIEEDGSFSYNGLIFGEGESGTFDIQSVYTVEVLIKDKLSEVTYTMPISSGRPHIAYAENGVSIMGKYDENVGGLFQVGGKRLDAGGDALPLGSIFKYDGNEVPSGYSKVDELIGEWAYLYLDYEKSISCSAWTYTTFPFGGDGKFLTSNSNLFEKNGNYIKCKFNGRVLAVATLTHNSGGQIDLILNNKRTLKVGGYFVQVIEVQEVTDLLKEEE